jgi:hypothetical protein
MTIQTNCLPIFENARVLLADAGLRRFDVVMRVVVWSGQTAGEGTQTVTDTPLVIQGKRPGVRRVEQKDVIASGGTYEDLDMRIGPFTPAFTGAGQPFDSGGLEPVDFNPGTDTSTREIYYKLTGPGMESGAWFKKIGQRSDSAFSYYLTVRKIATGEP